MKMNRMAAFSLLLVATACSSGNDSNSAGEQPAAEKNAPPQVSTEPVTIKFALNKGWLGPDEFQKYAEEQISKNIETNRQK